MYTSAQNDWSAEMLVVADGAGCEGGKVDWVEAAAGMLDPAVAEVFPPDLH